MTTEQFPMRRPDGSACVAALFGGDLDRAAGDLKSAFDEWHGLDLEASVDLRGEPRIVQSDAGFDLLFEIQPGSRYWRDLAVALVSAVQDRLGADAFLGFRDELSGELHPAARGRGPTSASDP